MIKKPEKKHLYFLLMLAVISCNKDDDQELKYKEYPNIVCNKVIQDKNQDFILTGSTYSSEYGTDIYAAKFDEQYEREWIFTLQLENNQSGQSVIETDQGFLITGNTYDENNANYSLKTYHINFAGALLWEKSYLSNSGYCQAGDIVSDGENGFIITASYKQSSNNDYMLLILKTDAAGDSVTSRMYPGAQNSLHNIVSFNNNYLVSTNQALITITDNLILTDFHSNDDFEAAKVFITNDPSIISFGNFGANHTKMIKYNEDFEVVFSTQFDNMNLLSLTNYGTNIFAVGKINDEYFDKMILTIINENGTVTFSKIYDAGNDALNYDRVAKQVLQLSESTFSVWENYNLTKLKIYNVNTTGELVD